MDAKEAFGWLFMALGITAAALAGAYLFLGLYAYALYALIAAVVCMEARVRLGFRNPRKGLFWAHLAASVLLVALLVLMMRGTVTGTLKAAAYLSYAVMAVAGGTLLYRTHRVYQVRKENAVTDTDP